MLQDEDGDGIPDATAGAGGGAPANSTDDGWDAGKSKSEVLGDIPGLGDAFRVSQRGVTFGMPEPHAASAPGRR
jgi:hypothetical protein